MFSAIKAYFMPPPPDPARLAAIQQQVEAMIQSPIAVFSKSYCPYCSEAKDLLEQRGQRSVTKTIELDGSNDGSVIQSYLAQRIGASRVTVPQIYIKGKLIGGCSELKAMDRSGELAQLLNQLKV